MARRVRERSHLIGGILILSILVPGALAGLTGDALAIPAWSRKYNVECQMCHSPVFARLNEYGERFLANGYQHPDAAEPDGDTEGKAKYSDLLFLDTNLGHWFTARLNLTPVAYETNARKVEGEVEDKVTIGNTNWLQLFVAGSITKNTSIYIENELVPDGIHQAWYYLGLHNVGNTPWINFQAGRLSPVIFAPYPDRLPQLPPIANGIMRVKSSNGKGEASLDMRSPRYGLQYYGHGGPLTVYGGVTPGPKPSNDANNLGYWAGARLWMPEGSSKALMGSSVGLHVDAGTDTKDADSLNVENAYVRIMPSVNLRINGRTDIQAAYVIATEDNRALRSANPEELDYQGLRMVGSHSLNNRWILSGHYDRIWSDDASQVAEYHYLFLPVVTYLWRENFRISLYPGFDLSDVDSDAKKHTAFVNIRTAF